MTIGATLIARNDDWGQNLNLRATYCLNSMIAALDQVVYVDWNSAGSETLIDVIRPNLLKTGKLLAVYVTPEEHKTFTNNDPEAEPCVGSLGRNVGLRRLTTDFKVATNIDIIAPRKVWFNRSSFGINTFYTISRRATSIHEFQHIPPTDPETLLDWVDNVWRTKQGQPRARVWPGDEWALIGNCGDWQMAYKTIWDKIQGYDQNLIYRAYADGNVQVKAAKFGFNLEPRWDVPVMHIHHNPHNGITHPIPTRHNDVAIAMMNVTGSRNDESWGYPDHPFRTEVI